MVTRSGYGSVLAVMQKYVGMMLSICHGLNDGQVTQEAVA